MSEDKIKQLERLVEIQRTVIEGLIHKITDDNESFHEHRGSCSKFDWEKDYKENYKAYFTDILKENGIYED